MIKTTILRPLLSEKNTPQAGNKKPVTMARTRPEGRKNSFIYWMGKQEEYQPKEGFFRLILCY